MPLGAGNSNEYHSTCNVLGQLTQITKKETQNFYLARKHEYFSSLQCKVTICEEMPPPNPSGSVSLCHSAVAHADCSEFRSDTALHHSSSPRDVHFSYSKHLGGGRGRFKSSAAETCNKNKDNAIIDEFSIHHSRHTKYHFMCFKAHSP